MGREEETRKGEVCGDCDRRKTIVRGLFKDSRLEETDVQLHEILLSIPIKKPKEDDESRCPNPNCYRGLGELYEVMHDLDEYLEKVANERDGYWPKTNDLKRANALLEEATKKLEDVMDDPREGEELSPEKLKEWTTINNQGHDIEENLSEAKRATMERRNRMRGGPEGDKIPGDQGDTLEDISNAKIKKAEEVLENIGKLDKKIERELSKQETKESVITDAEKEEIEGEKITADNERKEQKKESKEENTSRGGRSH